MSHKALVVKSLADGRRDEHYCKLCDASFVNVQGPQSPQRNEKAPEKGGPCSCGVRINTVDCHCRLGLRLRLRLHHPKLTSSSQTAGSSHDLSVIPSLLPSYIHIAPMYFARSGDRNCQIKELPQKKGSIVGSNNLGRLTVFISVRSQWVLPRQTCIYTHLILTFVSN
jgi:hypothetical protein